MDSYKADGANLRDKAKVGVIQGRLRLPGSQVSVLPLVSGPYILQPDVGKPSVTGSIRSTPRTKRRAFPLTSL